MQPRLLIPLDTLDHNHPALLSAPQHFQQASTHLLHVQPPTQMAGMLVRQLMHPERALYSAALETSLRELGPGEVITSRRIAHAILQRAQGGEFDLIVMGTRNAPARRFPLGGSMALQVIRRSPIPVLTVPPGQGAGRVRRALLLQDFSTGALRAWQCAQRFFPEARVQHLHVIDPGSLTTPFPPPRFSGSHSEQFLRGNTWWRAEARRRLDALGVGTLLEGPLDQVLLERANSGEYDLIVMGSRAMSVCQACMLGYLTRRLLPELLFPLLTPGQLPTLEAGHA